MKDIPEVEQQKIFTVVENNPELFQKIAAEVQEKIKGGKDQVTAAMEVMQKYQDDVRKAMN